ncbi:MAG TPA: putative sugar O-methyltransferase [Bryobacteraceae bacterium]|jgi:hypothetical protein
MIGADYDFVSLNDQKPIDQVERNWARDASRLVGTLLNQREHYILQRGLDETLWMPTANWHSGQPFYDYARALLDDDTDTIELLRLYAQQFSGYALWSMSKGEGQALPPHERTAIEESVRLAKLDTEAIARYRELCTKLPDYLKISPPKKFGEVGWCVDGVLVNHDTAAYWERLLLLYRSGFLDRTSGNALRKGSRILEIGGGYGALAWYVQEAEPEVSYTLLDLPESLAYSAVYLEVLHHGRTRFLANYQFPELVERGEKFDLVINTLSMSEMSVGQVRAYCQGIRKLLEGDGAFFEQNQDNTSVGWINAQGIIREYLSMESTKPFEDLPLIHGAAHVWRVRGS